DDGEPHDCVALTNQLCSPRADLKDEPLHNPDLVLYVDGSASHDPETGNARADKAAKQAANSPPQINYALPKTEATNKAFLQVSELQQRATPEEKAEWRKAGCVVKDGMWLARGPWREKMGPEQKKKLSKCCEETGLGWTKVLPIVLMQMHMRERPKYGLSPFEVLFGRPPNTGIGPVQTPVSELSMCDDVMLEYCATLSSALKSVHKQVSKALPSPATGPLHDLKPGDWVVVKDFRRTRWNKPRWTGPFQVQLPTHSAVKVSGRVTWVHTSHCRRAPDPLESLQSPRNEF
ncbi:hypothetical protein NFI96_020045, partial [Prochilodus magdalenae]